MAYPRADRDALRQVEVACNGKATPQACKGRRITEQTHHQLAVEYGGLWRRAGLKVPQKQPKRGRLW